MKRHREVRVDGQVHVPVGSVFDVEHPIGTT